MSSVIVGHKKRWDALARSFLLDRQPQTLLISGAARVGKWTLAQKYSRLLLCPHSRETEDEAGLPSPCGHCRVCHQVGTEVYPDFAVFRPLVGSAEDERDWVTAPESLEGSIVTVEMARKFSSEAMRKPMLGPRKVMVLNQADRMSNEAQNALLKTFEEPVHGLTIMLLAANPSSLLPTVLSRCWHLPLGLAAPHDVAAWLRGLNPGADETMIDEAVKAGAGRPGAAWREMQRLQAAGAEPTAASGGRLLQATRVLRRAERGMPVAAFALTEEALRLSRLWAAEDQGEQESKKPGSKMTRSAVAHFLDELSQAYRERWLDTIIAAAAEGDRPAVAADGPVRAAAALDQIRKTRHYILSNANINLALDVMFGNLISLQAEARR